MNIMSDGNSAKLEHKSPKMVALELVQVLEAMDEAAFIDIQKVRIFRNCFNFTSMNDSTVRPFMYVQVVETCGTMP